MEEGKKDGLSKKERRALKVAQKAGAKPSDIPAKVEINGEVIGDVKPKVKAPKNNVDNQPSKAQLRAERRALQEQQRLAKAAIKPTEEEKKPVEKKPVEKKSEIVISPPKKIEIKQPAQSRDYSVYLFNHLTFRYPDKNNCVVSGIHGSFAKLGVQYQAKIVCGSYSRCMALLSCLHEFVSDFDPPQNAEYCRALAFSLHHQMMYIENCRPSSVSMANFLKYFVTALSQVDRKISNSEKREILLDAILDYDRDQLDKAREAISEFAGEKIVNGDVILTYGWSSVIRKVLVDSHNEGKKFQVIVLDGRPMLEGVTQVKRLMEEGIDCSYAMINAISYVITKATKVFLGAFCLLANGAVMSRMGTAQVAMMANMFGKPVVVCCETNKCCERTQTDSFVYNELDDPDKLVIRKVTKKKKEAKCALNDWRQIPRLKPLNLMYDLTPPEFVTGVVTELGFLSSRSVPTILRSLPEM